MEFDYKSVKALLNKEITTFYRIFIESKFDVYCLDHVLYLEFLNKKTCFIIKELQDRVKIKECLSIEENNLKANIDFEIDDSEMVVLKEIKINDISLPLFIDSITEFWARIDEKKFLAGFILHGKNKKNSLYVYVETDEIELLNYLDFYKRIHDLPFYYGTILINWYN